MKLLHENLYVGGQLVANDFALIKEAGINTIINNRPDNEEPGQLNSIEAKLLAKELDIQYFHLPMANGQPLTPNLVDDFKLALENADNGVLAHCRSGMRSSFIWALGQIAAGNISVDDAILKAQKAGIPLGNARSALENVQPK